VLLYLGDHVDGVPAALRLRLNAQRVIDVWKVAGLELDVDDGADDLDDFADLHL